MAGGKKGKKKKRGAKKPAPSSLGRVVFAISLVACIVLVSGFLVMRYLPPPAVQVPHQRHAPVERPAPLPVPPPDEAVTEVPLSEPPEEPPAQPVVSPPGKPTLVLIIDDIGESERMAFDLMALDPAVTLAILPRSPHGKAIARAARKASREVILHQPMEPVEYPKVDPGPGALLADMDPDRLLGILTENLAAYPEVKGVNNHMGSMLTTLSPQMYQVMTLMKKNGLYFIDSRTAGKSVARSAARLMQVPFAGRDIFLDNVQTREAVARQIQKMLAMAEKHGNVVAICHPHDVTYATLAEMMPEIQRRVTLVRPSAVVALP